MKQPRWFSLARSSRLVVMLTCGAALAGSLPAHAQVTPLHVLAGSEGRNPFGALVKAVDGSFYGTTLHGGPNGYGTIFKLDAAGTLSTLHAFNAFDGAYPYARLLQAADGNFYGTTLGHGAGGSGTIFKLDAAGTLTTLHAFTASEGGFPYSSLLQAPDGSIYGTTLGSGPGTPNGFGTVYRLDATGNFTTVHAFTGADGQSPYGGLLKGSDSFLYGTTAYGGPGGYGTIFRIDTAGTFTTLHAFDGTDGGTPYAGLVQASNGSFYGTTVEGGAGGYGTIFRLDPAGTFTSLYAFDIRGGRAPFSRLIQATDGNLYGTTLRGGPGDYGTIFRLNTAGRLTTLHAFTSADGANPYAGLLQVSAGNFYGTTYSGGVAGGGVVYRLTIGPGPALFPATASAPAGGTTTVSAVLTAAGSPVAGKTLTFALNGTPVGSAVTGADGVATVSGASIGTASVGSYPGGVSASFAGDGSLAAASGTADLDVFAATPVIVWPSPVAVPDGTVLGSAQLNATANLPGTFTYSPPAGTILHTGMGQVLSVTFTPANTIDYASASASVSINVVQRPVVEPTTLYAFGPNDGAFPYGDLIQGIDGNFYGTTQYGGVGNFGTVFKIDAAGSLTTLHTFNGIDGKYPGSGLLQAADGKFYGTTGLGGANGWGTIFRMDAAGTLTTLHSFDYIGGALAQAALIQVADGSFYGTTYVGGALGVGTIYKLDPAGTFTVVHSFDGSDGANPYAPLLRASDGSMYGTASNGGPSGNGTIFKIDGTGALTTVRAFSGNDGAFPVAGLIQGNDGGLYGTTLGFGRGSSSGFGTIFRMDAAGSLTTLHVFAGSDGGYPSGRLIQGSDGNFYGTTGWNGENRYSTVFKLDGWGALTTLHAFSFVDGAIPYAGLVQAGDGRLYGTTTAGGPPGRGVVFRLALSAAVTELAPAPATGVFGGSTTLAATLTSGGWPLPGKTVSFVLNGTAVGSAATNAAGLATLGGVSLAGIAGGPHAGAVQAAFAGEAMLAAASGSAGLQIAPAAPVVTWPTPAGIVHGTPLGSTQLNATASVAGSFAYTPPSGTILPVGAGQTLSVTFTPSDTSSYSVVSATVLLNVANRPPVLLNPGNQINGDMWGYAQAVLADRPAGYWRLGDTTGTSAADSAGGYTGTGFGGITRGQAGALADGNPAMLFNGSTGHFRVANPAPVSLAGDLSIEMWLNVSLAARQTLISKSYLSEFELTLEASGRLTFYQGTGTTYQGALSTYGAVAANTWQHVVVTRTVATNTIRFYVNGVEKGSGTYVTPPSASTKSISIGRSEAGTQYVNGRLDEVALYPAVLTAAQVAAHYGLGTSAGSATVIALPLVASDPDADALTYSATGLPPALAINAATGLISGTLTAASVGTHLVTATVSDGSLLHTQAFTWTITHVNRAPVLINPGNQTSVENTSISVSLSGSDPEGAPVTYGVSGLPASLALNTATGLISGTLSPTSAGTYVVTATVSDGGLSSAQTFTWTVADSNLPPILANPGPRTNSDTWGYAQAVLSDAPAAYWRLGETTGTSAADSAGTNTGTVFGGVTPGQAGAIADGSPAMLFNGSTGYVRVANSAALQMAGDLTIELWLNASLAARQTLISKDYLHEFELTLETSGKLNLYQGNGTSFVGTSSALGAVTANIWQHVVVTRTAATKTIRFYVNGVAKGSGVYTTAPTTSTKVVSLGRSESGTQYVNGRLDEVALYPAVLSAAQITAHYALRTSAGTPTVVALQLVASDPAGDTLTYSAVGLPATLAVNAATGLISGTLSPASAGTYQVTATASDGSLSSSQTFTWTVTHINRNPTLANPGNQTSAENTSVSLQLAASDPDGDGLTYSATGLPASLSLNPATGLISGALSFTSAGTYLVTATVSDGSLSSIVQTLTWTIANTNRPPVLAAPGDQTTSDTQGYAQAVLADAAVAYWRLGENTGTSAADSAGANAGTAFGGVTPGQSGALADGNTAMLFNGSTGYVMVGNGPAVQLTGDLTIELWVNVPLTARQTLISKDYLHEFELTLEVSGKLNFYQGNGTVYQGIQSPVGAVAANTWQHVVVTRTAATNTIRFYVNGVAKGSGTYATAATTSTRPISIGRSDAGTQYVNGRLDEVALYPVALSAAQIAAHYGWRTSVDGANIVSLPLIASDPDGDGLSFSATGLPPALTVNASTGLISGTLSPTSAGTYSVIVTASDAVASTSRTFTWTVTHNGGPE